MVGVVFVLGRLPLEEGLPSGASGVGGCVRILCGVFAEQAFRRLVLPNVCRLHRFLAFAKRLSLEDLAATYSPTP